MALDGQNSHAKFCTRLELAPSMLTVAVDGVGPLKYPTGPKRAAELIALAAPASYGRGEATLTNPTVRNTWEVPKQPVHAQWAAGALEAALDSVREGLGLPSEGRLHAEPHSVLVYEKGQFFLPHQDSEKHDDMIGTLVVTLPSRFQGGELVVEHGKATEVCAGSPEKISLTAFYGDCRHEVNRVRSGYRITLAYNLLYQGDTRPVAASGDPRTRQLTQLLDEHFQTPVSEPYSRKPATPPQRLAFLLDHEYTEKNLAWHRLKGEDARYAALLRTAADAADCHTVLGLNEIQETWDAYPAHDDDYYYDYEEDEDSDEEEHDGEYELNDLIESSIRLVHWVDPDTGEAEKISLDIDQTELCTHTKHPHIEPYKQNYEGYMGNYGNTLDRWYRRAALIIWPRRLDPNLASPELYARLRPDVPEGAEPTHRRSREDRPGPRLAAARSRARGRQRTARGRTRAPGRPRPGSNLPFADRARRTRDAPDARAGRAHVRPNPHPHRRRRTPGDPHHPARGQAAQTRAHEDRGSVRPRAKPPHHRPGGPHLDRGVGH
jgi:predicted 2-oxoglutarate/Fe(II)-dependent dioxygenase YbiX